MELVKFIVNIKVSYLKSSRQQELRTLRFNNLLYSYVVSDAFASETSTVMSRLKNQPSHRIDSLTQLLELLSNVHSTVKRCQFKMASYAGNK